jgi:hypothetical protein
MQFGLNTSFNLSFGYDLTNIINKNNAVFWDMATCGSCENCHFGWQCLLHLRDRKIRKLERLSGLDLYKDIKPPLHPTPPIYASYIFHAPIFLLCSFIVSAFQLWFSVLATANAFSTLKKAQSFETLVLTRPTWRHIPAGCILHSHCYENLKSYYQYIVLLCLACDSENCHMNLQS